jgi:hypothetical protein
MPGETLSEELRDIRKRYHHSTVSLRIFVRKSLKEIDQRRDELLAISDMLRGSTSDDEALNSIFKRGARPDFDAGKMRRTLEMALADAMHIREPHKRMLLEMSVAYASSLFDGLVSDVLTTVFRHFPEALRSGRTLTAEEALAFRSRQELVEELARRDALELAYKSIENQFGYFRKAFKVDPLDRESLNVSITDLAAIHERRNLIVHNNGLASGSYVEKYCPTGSVGDPVIVDAESAESDCETLRKVGLALIYSFDLKFRP